MNDPSCSFDFSGEHLQALWLEFQQSQAASCPETGAPIGLELLEEGAAAEAATGLTTEPTVRVRCERCGRQEEFRPGVLTGVQEVE